MVVHVYYHCSVSANGATVQCSLRLYDCFKINFCGLLLISLSHAHDTCTRNHLYKLTYTSNLHIRHAFLRTVVLVQLSCTERS